MAVTSGVGKIVNVPIMVVFWGPIITINRGASVGWREGAINGFQMFPNGVLPTHNPNHPGEPVSQAN